MPLYEYRKNAKNPVPLPLEVQQAIVCGTEPVVNRIVELLHELKQKKKHVTAALDGWYGVDWVRLRAGLQAAAKARGLSLKFESVMGLYQSAAEIERYRQPYVTDDPSFGRVNRNGTLSDILDGQKIADLKNRLISQTVDDVDAVIVLGPGADLEELDGLFDVRFYADFTMQPLLWQMWDGRLVTFGRDEPAKNYIWKNYYYCDFYLLLRQKKQAFARMDYYCGRGGRTEPETDVSRALQFDY